MKLTFAHKHALGEIRNGADIFSPALARLLREVEKGRPELLTITKPMGTYKVSEVYPYFGAILTAAGEAAVRGKRRSPSTKSIASTKGAAS